MELLPMHYRCPHCGAPNAADELRAGESHVCVACLTPHQMPADSAAGFSQQNGPGVGTVPPVLVPAAGSLASSHQPEAVRLETQADIAAALTAALSSRMKPPLPPRRDILPSTAAWILLSGFGLVLLLLALVSSEKYRWPLLAIGIVQIICGYVWIVRITYLRDPQRGLLCAIPPLTVYYLAQYKYARLHPLRFAATGAAMVLLAISVPVLSQHTIPLFNRTDSTHIPPTDPEELSKLEQLRYYRERQAFDPLVRMLETLAKTDPILSEDASDYAELTAELKQLCRHTNTRVKVQAMAAYTRWDPDSAHLVCLEAIGSTQYQEREMALKLLPRWKDAKSARAIQSLIGGSPSVESLRAKAALEEIGGPPAEEAAITLLMRADSQALKLTALAILEKVGGVNSVAFLRNYAMAAEDSAVRAKAFSTAEALETRSHPPAP